jgi:broad specificity phosphatase PhoE
MAVTELLLIRHGESQGNVAAARARASGAEELDVPARDADVDLSDLGRQQASAVGAALGALAADTGPQALVVSPYLRARETARIACEKAGLDLPTRVDERLRDRELGVLDRLTFAGVQARYPEEAARRAWQGKFYHRPAGGESWADVALRLRSVMADIDRLEAGRRVLVVCHDAVIMLFRYVCEGMDEEQLLELGRTSTVRNASLTRLVRPSGLGLWTAQEFNRSEHLSEHGAAVTDHGSDAPVDPHQDMEPAQAASS